MIGGDRVCHEGRTRESHTVYLDGRGIDVGDGRE